MTQSILIPRRRLWLPKSIDGYMASNLKEQLVAAWPLDEPSGTRRDRAGIGAPNDLTDNNTVTGAAGPSIYIPLASQFTAANTEYLSLADNASISLTGSHTICAWVFLDSAVAFAQIAGKGRFLDAATLEYAIGTSTGGTAVRYGKSDGTTLVQLDHSIAVATGTWYFVMGWLDTDADTINIQVNNSTVSSAATTTGVQDSTNAFGIGGQAAAQVFNGRIAGVGLWGRVLTAQERTWLYNGGSGRSLSQLRLAA